MSALPKDNDFRLKRKRSPSPSNLRRDRSPPTHRRRSNSNSDGGDRMPVDKEPPAKPQEASFDAVAEFRKLTTGTRSGGVYMPPARLRALQEEASKDKTSPEYQRLSWDALRKSITGIVNRVNIVNIKQIVPELFNENLVRGKGLFARSIMKAQAASLPFTPVFACLVAVINTKLPTVGELVLVRLVSQFRRSFKRNDKPICVATSTFIAHLVNQSVADSALALQIIILLLERPTDSSVEIAVGFMKEVGAYLSEFPKENNLLFDRFRAVLHEGAIDKRVQYMIEVLFQVRKDQYKDNPMIAEGLDLVEQEDQITHEISLDDKLEIQESLNVFKFDPDYLRHEEEYKEFKAEVLGDDDSESEEGGSDSDSDDEEAPVQEKEGIQDKTETNLVNLRRVIYLTLQNALGYEEAVHKLLKIKIQEGEEIELCNMVIECASQERTYSRYYGLIGERLCKLNRVWYDCFEQAFGTYYETIHRYETNRLRIIAKLFGHLLANDAISWSVLEAIKMNENDTTSASRIFVKIMMQEMNESMGTKTLAERFKDPDVRQHTKDMFPTDLPKNTRFSINFFTSINLGVLTLEMREHLTNAQKLLMEQRAQAPSSSSSDSDSDSDSSSDSDSGSDDSRSRSRSRSVSPRRRSRSRDSSRNARRRYDSRSRSPRRTPPSSSRKRYEDSPPPKSRRSRSPRRGEQYRRRSSSSPDDRRRSPPRKSTRKDSRSRSPRRDDRDRGYGRKHHDRDSRSRTPPGRRGSGGDRSYSRR